VNLDPDPPGEGPAYQINISHLETGMAIKWQRRAVLQRIIQKDEEME
jgi:hypothetical protein